MRDARKLFNNQVGPLEKKRRKNCNLFETNFGIRVVIPLEGCFLVSFGNSREGGCFLHSRRISLIEYLTRPCFCG
jgi:hypothetical protein